MIKQTTHLVEGDKVTKVIKRTETLREIDNEGEATLCNEERNRIT